MRILATRTASSIEQPWRIEVLREGRRYVGFGSRLRTTLEVVARALKGWQHG